MRKAAARLYLFDKPRTCEKPLHALFTHQPAVVTVDALACIEEDTVSRRRQRSLPRHELMTLQNQHVAVRFRQGFGACQSGHHESTSS
jgi:hypothetical protein